MPWHVLLSSEPRQHLRKIGAIAQDLRELRLRCSLVSYSRLFKTEQVAGLPELGHLANQIPERLDRFARPMLRGQRNRPLEIIGRALRLQTRGLGVVGQGMVHVTPTLLCEPSIEVRIGERRVGQDGPRKAGNGIR